MSNRNTRISQIHLSMVMKSFERCKSYLIGCTYPTHISHLKTFHIAFSQDTFTLTWICSFDNEQIARMKKCVCIAFYNKPNRNESMSVVDNVEKGRLSVLKRVLYRHLGCLFTCVEKEAIFLYLFTWNI